MLVSVADVVMFHETRDAADVPPLEVSEEQPLLAPVTPQLSWSWVHELTQSPPDPRRPADFDTIARIRRSATIRRGTRMTKLLTARQLTAYLHGRLPGGFCYRAHDLAPLRTAADLAMLTGDAGSMRGEDVVFGLRWRALDPADYHVPFSASATATATMPTTAIIATPTTATATATTVAGTPTVANVDPAPYAGLVAMRPHERLGPAVLGTGFAPSRHHVVPEFVTADLADLPMPANASLVAFTADGTEVTLYLYLPEQRAWTRMFGPQWRHLFAAAPDVKVDQEYIAVSPHSRSGVALLGRYRGETYEAIADPPHEYRVLAKVRAARYPVEALARRTTHVRWRGVPATVVRIEADWVRLRLIRPDDESMSTVGAQCVERGIYECWAPAVELSERQDVDHEYVL